MGVLAALALVVAQAAAPAAQPPAGATGFAGRTITQADVVIDGQVSDDPTLRDLVETRPGTPLSIAAVRESIAHIYSLGRFQEVSVHAFEAPGGVRLRFELVPLQTIEEIDFRGELGLRGGELRRAVTDRFGSAPSASRASAAAELLQRYYFERGYLDAAIRPTIEERGTETVLTFDVRSGPRARIRNVRVNGDPGEPHGAFLRRIHADPGRVYQLADVQARLGEHIQRMRRNGRYEAGGSHRMESRSDDGQSVDLAVTIETGPAVTVTFEGDPLPKDRLDELVPVRREGSVDVDIIEDSEQRIVRHLNEQGYWKATVTSTRREADGRLDIIFTVRKGLPYRVAGGVEVAGNTSVPLIELRPAFAALEEGRPFVARQLDVAASAVRGIYMRRGFARVKVDRRADELAAAGDEGRVKPVLTVTEGPLMRVGEVTFTGNAAVPTADLQARLTIAPGQPYFDPNVIRDREAVLREYLNRGFPSATVDVKPTVTADARVNLAFAVTEGVQTFVDHILIVGNVKTRAEVIERELDTVQPGQPLGLEALFEARRRLSELGLFRRIRISEIVHGETGRRDLLVTVEEAPSTSLGYGGGLELNNRLDTGETGQRSERLELAPRGFFEAGRRNIGGKNRTANLYTRLSLRSADDPGGSDLFGFADYRIIGTYREPKTFGWNADVTITAAVEQGVRSTFNFSRRGVTADITRRLSPRVRGSARYTLGTTRTFGEVLNSEDEQDILNIDRIFPKVRLSAFSASITHDTRDDPLNPARGFFLSGEGSLAARSLGGEVGFIRSYLQGHAYRQLPVSRRVVLAGRLALGLADGFPRQVETRNDLGEIEVRTVEDLPASERFFAGGDTTVRGFALDSVGTSRTLTERGFPRGGNGLVLANLELRFPVWRDLGAAVFVDGGNVFERVTQIDLTEVRGSVGVGVRYVSPVGPLRFDVGFKLDPQEGRERRRAFHFSFGQAF